jgi:hypothetical protein
LSKDESGLVVCCPYKGKISILTHHPVHPDFQKSLSSNKGINTHSHVFPDDLLLYILDEYGLTIPKYNQ